MSICYQWVILDEHVVTKILHLAQSQVSIKLSVILFPIYVIKITQFRAKIAILSRDLRTVWARSDSDWWDGGDKMYQSKTIILDLNRRNNRMRSSVISDALSLECILETTLLIIMYNSCKCSKNNFRLWKWTGHSGQTHQGRQRRTTSWGTWRSSLDRHGSKRKKAIFGRAYADVRIL